MFGQRRDLNLIIILTAGLLIGACGKKHSEAPVFLKAQIVDKGNGSGLSADRRATRTWKDYDGDGLPDRMDPDIDDDGVPNLADQYPFNEKKIGEDKDNDGIPDFIDLNTPIQQKIHKELGVFVINGSETFNEEEWKSIEKTLFNSVMLQKLKYDLLKTVVRYSAKEQLDLSRADYDPYWEQISFFPNEDHKEILSFNGSLVHELGHVHAAENKELFSDFEAAFSDWTSPSEYGESSADEGYAEQFTYEFYLSGELAIDQKRFKPSFRK